MVANLTAIVGFLIGGTIKRMLEAVVALLVVWIFRRFRVYTTL